jgi:hypothetical protein
MRLTNATRNMNEPCGTATTPQTCGIARQRIERAGFDRCTLSVMDATLERLAREAGLNDIVDLRRHDAGPALELFAALVAERCASIAACMPIERTAEGHKDTPQKLGRETADAIRSAFPMPGLHGRSS